MKFVWSMKAVSFRLGSSRSLYSSMDAGHSGDFLFANRLNSPVLLESVGRPCVNCEFSELEVLNHNL